MRLIACISQFLQASEYRYLGRGRGPRVALSVVGGASYLIGGLCADGGGSVECRWSIERFYTHAAIANHPMASQCFCGCLLIPPTSIANVDGKAVRMIAWYLSQDIGGIEKEEDDCEECGW